MTLLLIIILFLAIGIWIGLLIQRGRGPKKTEIKKAEAPKLEIMQFQKPETEVKREEPPGNYNDVIKN